MEKTEEAEAERLSLAELDGWLNVKIKSSKAQIDVKVEEITKNISSEIASTKANISTLISANLHNPKISVRETQFMEGNRSAYILAVNNFLRLIEFEDREPNELLNACNEFSSRLEKFGKNTVRPYHILQEFFANESRDIAINIKNIERLMIELKIAISPAKLDRIETITALYLDIQGRSKRRNALEDGLEESKRLLDEMVKNRITTESELAELMKRKEYKNFLELKAEKEAVLATIREENSMIINSFSAIERPLKKLDRMVAEDNRLLQKYVENCVDALVFDKDLKIFAILGKLEQNINNLTLDLKDKKREKVLLSLKSITREYLTGFQNRRRELSDKLRSLEASIGQNQSHKEERKLLFDLETAGDDIERIQGEVNNLSSETAKCEIKESKEKIAKEINECFGTNVFID
ncbi:MAG TPA: hypothetical protein VFF28_07765 [Candidatus Nanoarchaeia archaeon]|nr:hypothetical protein [Candidatus Nanoarchaeia archaeon]